MKQGLRKVDKAVDDLVRKAVRSGRWICKGGRKHLKMVLSADHSKWVTVTGSSGDPVRAAKNLMSDIRRCEREAGYADSSL